MSLHCCGAFDLNKNQPTTAWFVVSYSVSFVVGYESMSIPNHHVISLLSTLTSQHDHSIHVWMFARVAGRNDPLAWLGLQVSMESFWLIDVQLCVSLSCMSLFIDLFSSTCVLFLLHGHQTPKDWQATSYSSMLVGCYIIIMRVGWLYNNISQNYLLLSL